MTTVLYLHDKTAISGGERSLLALWQNLDRTHVRPVLAVPDPGPLAVEARRLDVEVAELPVPRLSPVNWPGIVTAVRGLHRLCVYHQVAIIHSYTPRNNMLAALYGRCTGVKVVWHERNLVFGSEPDKSRAFSFLAHRIICNSAAVAQRFSRDGTAPANVSVVLNGVDVARFHPGTADPARSSALGIGGHPVVGLVSNLGRRKGVEAFLEAGAFVVREVPGVRLLVVGGQFGDEREDRLAVLRGEARRLGIGSSVVFAGAVADVENVLPLLDVGVAVTEKEACSRAILEMMACGKPVVGFATGGNPELVQHGVSGVLVPPGDTADLARQIVRLLLDATTRQRMGVAARARIEQHFDVRTNARTTERVYRELLGGLGLDSAE